jgi:putative ABC transport system permease protein
METLIQDIRYGVRMLAKKPGLTIVTVLTLALGIGANTAIFSVVNAALLRALPYENPDQLVVVWEHNRPRNKARNSVSPANFLSWCDQNTVFDGLAALYTSRINLTGVEDPEEVQFQGVTPNFFSLLGVSPAIGRPFAPGDGEAGAEGVILLSHGLWQRRFGADPNIVGRTILLNGQNQTVVGVMPSSFNLTIKEGTLTSGQPELWTPMVFTEQHRTPRGRYIAAIGRLKPGVTVEHAQAEMSSIASRLEQHWPDFDTGWGINLVPLKEQQVGSIRMALLVLLGAVGLVLLIACANVANLLLMRAAARRKEIAVRAALGADRWRVIRQLLTESVLLAGMGGGVGLLLALWGVELLLALAPSDLVGLAGVGLDYRVLGFTLGVSLLTGLVFGLAPALEASRMNFNETLKEGGKSATTDKRTHRLRHALVVTEIALAIVLLIGSGLLIRSFLGLQAVDPGFNPENLLTVKVSLPASKYPEDHQKILFFRQLLDRVGAVPGVRSASAINFLPYTGPGAATKFTVEGRPAPPPGEDFVTEVSVVDPGYFQTMNIPLVAGRTFTSREATEISRVAVINEAMARQYFPGEDPIGKRVTVNMGAEPAPTEIVGIVRDVRNQGLDLDPKPMVYWPHPELTYPFMTLVIRTGSDPLALASAVKREVQALDPDQPVADVRVMEQWLADSTSRARFTTLLLAIFAGVALLLAMVGIYGVLSYAVAQRTHEIGIRMALGAQRGDVLRMVVGQALLLTGIGVAVGLTAALIVTRLLSSLLFGVSATDVGTYAVIALFFFAVSLVASMLPARRAVNVDPMVALR